MKIKRVLKYPKLIMLGVIVIVTYIVFRNPTVVNFISQLDSLNYFGIFFAGMMYTFGFTSPISAGFFLTLHPENIFVAGIIGGVGAMFSDLFIFKFVRFSFMDEFKKIKQEKIILKIKKFFKNLIVRRVRRFFAYIFAGILIASPLPDEAGVVILAGLTKIKTKAFMMIGFILNTIGIIIILSLHD